MSAYNTSAEYITEAVESVINQTYKDWELIIIDDGSTNKLKEILKKYLRRKNIKYFYQKNQVQAVGRNNGVKKSKGKLIAFLDSDDAWKKNKLELQIKKFNDSSVGIVGGGVEWFDQATEKVVKTKVPHKKGYVFNDLIVHNFLNTSTIIIRKNVFKPFKKTMKMVEDYELWLNICRFWKYDFTKQVVCKYRVHSHNESHNLKKRYTAEIKVKNKFFQYAKGKKRTMKKSLWDTNFNIAYAFYIRKDNKNAMKYLRRAIRSKCDIRNLKLFVRIVFGL
ncbi:glycosyltransferase [Candidatus Woesearchaeota archaeon]|nr:glycosyltransferase [Candidatus Woesearchaeota archaeon]